MSSFGRFDGNHLGLIVGCVFLLRWTSQNNAGVKKAKQCLMSLMAL